MEVPETRYALREGHHIGYQVWGEGPLVEWQLLAVQTS
jgi:hypothetical protein